MSIEGKTNLLGALYNDRENFAIIGLTGYTGTGCSRLAKTMSMDIRDWPDLRNPDQLEVPEPKTVDNDELLSQGLNNHKSIAAAIFKRKYSICYDFTHNNPWKFAIVKYSKVLLFYTFRFLSRQYHNGNIISEKFAGILKDKYRPSKEYDSDYLKLFDNKGEGDLPWEEFINNLSKLNINWDAIFELFKVQDDVFDRYCFFDSDSSFSQAVDTLMQGMWKADAYCTTFFFHRLAYVLRATGDPCVSSSNIRRGKFNNDGNNLYCIAELINKLIKAYRRKHDGKCRIVIDKIRNSLEAKYLKERYSAFYFVAVHEDRDVESHLRNRLCQNYESRQEIRANSRLIECQVKRIIKLDSNERRGRDFDSGYFFAQNLGQCMADAEIHISNQQGLGGNAPTFYSMSEQWMKFATLIQHPGLISPSSEERCMVVAYTAKFNSGCLSRQVGAVITNKAHTIRTIGWNDVPYGQIPCSLRQLPVLAIGAENNRERAKMYSAFEIGRASLYKDGESFDEKVRLKYKDLHLKRADNRVNLMKGLPYSYCFKTLHNEFEEVKNQVHTRSLHAEENAIMQMAKYGGEALHDGIIYVTASPCELCCKKLYQVGVRKIVYIDEYPGISRENIISNGYLRPHLKQFQGAYGVTYFKLYQPIISYKDELSIRLNKQSNPPKSTLKDLADNLEHELANNVGTTDEDYVQTIEKIKKLLNIDK